MIRSFGLMVCAMGMVQGWSGPSANSQQTAESTAQPVAAPSDAAFPSKAELQRRIALYEDAQRSAEATHPGLDSMVKIYSNLAALYENAGMLTKAEDEMRREIAVLRTGPQNELAEAMGYLAGVHIAMGDERQAEKDDLEALRIRESVGDPVGTALTWSDLAGVHFKLQHYKKALDFAQRAMLVLADNPKVDVGTRIAVRQTLAFTLCGLKQCGQAIPLLKDALQMGKSSYGADSLLVGAGQYLLGYAYWQNGDMDEAAEWMALGTGRLKADQGLGHTIYLSAMSEYAKFLRQRGQLEEAAAAEREVKMANAVVDARSLAPSASAFAAAGTR